MSTLSTTNVKNPSSGSNNIVLAADGSTTITTLTGTTITGTSVRGGITSGTVVASTSGTSIDFTSIPSYVKRITVMFDGVSTNGSSHLRIQIGSGSIGATGYASTNGTIGAVSVGGATGGTAGWDIITSSSSATAAGSATLAHLGSNIWVFNSLTSLLTSTNTNISAGNKTALSGTLDRVRITTVNGTDTFDAGSINILMEG